MLTIYTVMENTELFKYRGGNPSGYEKIYVYDGTVLLVPFVFLTRFTDGQKSV